MSVFVMPVWGQTGSISGMVEDEASGEPIQGAHVLLVGQTYGMVSDQEGFFEIKNLDPGEHTILISFTWYESLEVVVEVIDGESTSITARLVEGIELDPVQVTAGRKREKTLQAPASISVVTGEEIELEASQTAVDALRNVTGVDLVKLGIDSYVVALRGFSGIYGSRVHILTDYRNAGMAVIGANINSIMPSVPIDVERTEVVRGAGSALYGAGVDSGVIHYISKDPFSYPGAVLTVAGGQRSLLSIQGRVAGVLGDKLGLKLLGSYARGNDFVLESCSEDLLMSSMFDQCPDFLDAQQLALDGERESDFNKLILSGFAEYRFGRNTSFNLSGGVATTNTTLLTQNGPIQAVNLMGLYGQLRFNSGPFFAQAYTNWNDTGDSYIYGSGAEYLDYSRHTQIQAQYSFDLGWDRQELIVGADAELLTPDTRGTVNGRFEDTDDITEIGGYIHSKTNLGDKLDLVLALRGDQHNHFDYLFWSPSLGLVYTPGQAHSFRATFNSTTVTPSSVALFLDIVFTQIPTPFGGINIRGLGNPGGFTWNRNPDYLNLGAPSDLVSSSLFPGMEGTDIPLGMETGMVYGLLYGGIQRIPDVALAGALVEAFGLNPALFPALVPQMAVLKELLHPSMTRVQGFSQGQLGDFNAETGGVTPIGTDLVDISELQPEKSRFWELGYTGILGDRLLMSADVYYAQQDNALRGSRLITPLVVAPTLSVDLTQDLALGIGGNTQLVTLLDALGDVVGVEVTAEEAAAFIVGLAGANLPSPFTPIGIVQPTQNNFGPGVIPELLSVGYNFGRIQYFGADIGAQFLVSDQLSLFGNLSWVSDDIFYDVDDGGGEGSPRVALNAPAMKFKFGGTLRTDFGFSVSASGRYVDSFEMESGRYVGTVDSYFLLDLGLGYDFGGGFRADLNVSNLLNNEHRQFLGSPKIGRIGTVRMLYSMDW